MAGLKLGLLQVYTGDGKGKTSAALGLALRAVGWGLRVLMVQFLKSSAAHSGEVEAAKTLAPNLALMRLSPHSFLGPIPDEIYQKTRSLYREYLEKLQETIQRAEYDVFILDEALVALKLGLVNKPQLQALLAARPPQVEVVLTGRGCPQWIIDLADLVSEINLIKHPYQQGIPARPGIEY